jgi:hypothetical protein
VKHLCSAFLHSNCRDWFRAGWIGHSNWHLSISGNRWQRMAAVKSLSPLPFAISARVVHRR